MTRSVLIALMVLAPLTAAADEKTDWTAAARKRLAAEADRWVKAQPLKAEQAPTRDAQKGVFLCPKDKQQMIELRRELKDKEPPSDAQLQGLYCPQDRRLYHVSGAGQGLAFRGPVTVHRVTYQTVKKALQRHMTDSDQQGFYANRFRKLQEMGPETAVQLLAIYNQETKQQIRTLAIDALGEVGNRSKAITDALHKVAMDRTAGPYVQAAVVALARLGKRELFDKLITNMKTAGQDLLAEPAQRGQAYVNMALLYSRMGEQDKAMAAYQKALKLTPEQPTIYYNIACHYATIGKPDEAFKYLNQSIDKGFSHWEWMRVDGDLKSLHKDPRWKKLLARQNEKKKQEDSQDDFK